MDKEILVSVEHVSKKFCKSLKKSLWYGIKDIAGEVFGCNNMESQLRPDEFWAVNDVSFELRRGECLGLIGRNGAGKSTLLKMLNGLIKPDQGRITIRGRVGALIELGAGFNPILTGRENIYINGSVLGLTKKEIDKKFDAIVEFAEIGEYLDMPVQNYSSGMKVRLGFAVAAQMEPDVLIIDEVLAVGDAGFRSKCYSCIGELIKTAAVIFVSHSMPQVARIANVALLMELGHVACIGPTSETIYQYNLKLNFKKDFNRHGTQRAKIVGLYFQGVDKHDKQLCVKYGETINGKFLLNSKIKTEIIITFCVYTVDGEPVAEFSNFVTGNTLLLNAGQTVSVPFRLRDISLNPGKYRLSVILGDSKLAEHFDWWVDCYELMVTGRPGMARVQFQLCLDLSKESQNRGQGNSL